MTRCYITCYLEGVAQYVMLFNNYIYCIPTPIKFYFSAITFPSWKVKYSMQVDVEVIW